MRVLRLACMVLYASYLTNVGLLLILLPWSEAWTRLILMTSPKIAMVLDSPAVRGGLTAFGALHLVLVLAELAAPTLDAKKDR